MGFLCWRMCFLVGSPLADGPMSSFAISDDFGYVFWIWIDFIEMMFENFLVFSLVLFICQYDYCRRNYYYLFAYQTLDYCS